jgi:hypothetical protein
MNERANAPLLPATKTQLQAPTLRVCAWTNHPTYIALFAYIVIQNTDVRTQSRSAINSSRFMNRYLDSIRNDGLRGQRLIIHQAQSQA